VVYIATLWWLPAGDLHGVQESNAPNSSEGLDLSTDSGAIAINWPNLCAKHPIALGLPISNGIPNFLSRSLNGNF
jgi:hypothetical protein